VYTAGAGGETSSGVGSMECEYQLPRLPHSTVAKRFRHHCFQFVAAELYWTDARLYCHRVRRELLLFIIFIYLFIYLHRFISVLYRFISGFHLLFAVSNELKLRLHHIN